MSLVFIVTQVLLFAYIQWMRVYLFVYIQLLFYTYNDYDYFTHTMNTYCVHAKKTSTFYVYNEYSIHDLYSLLTSQQWVVFMTWIHGWLEFIDLSTTRSVLQNIISFIGLFCKRDLQVNNDLYSWRVFIVDLNSLTCQQRLVFFGSRLLKNIRLFCRISSLL